MDAATCPRQRKQMLALDGRSSFVLSASDAERMRMSGVRAARAYVFGFCKSAAAFTVWRRRYWVKDLRRHFFQPATP